MDFTQVMARERGFQKVLLYAHSNLEVGAVFVIKFPLVAHWELFNMCHISFR